MNDGALGTESDSANGTDLAGTSTFTLTFDISVNTLGYDITEIATYAGWNVGSGGRSNQGYGVQLTFMDDSTATLLSSTTWEPNSPAEFWTRVVHTNSGGGALDNGTTVATGVKAITFDGFDPSNVGAGIVVWREFDILGTATIPEPSTASLLVGALGILYTLRRRRA